MGNCVRRETGLELDNDAKHKENLNEIKKRILFIKNTWKERLAEKDEISRKVKTSQGNIMDQILYSDQENQNEIIQKSKTANISSNGDDILNLKFNLEDKSNRNTPNKASYDIENEVYSLNKKYVEDNFEVRETNFIPRDSNKLYFNRPSVKKGFLQNAKLKVRNLDKEEEDQIMKLNTLNI